jgi:hypothetical protein
MATTSRAPASSPTTLATLPCCPDMTPDDTCDVLDFHYASITRLHFSTPVHSPGYRSRLNYISD